MNTNNTGFKAGFPVTFNVSLVLYHSNEYYLCLFQSSNSSKPVDPPSISLFNVYVYYIRCRTLTVSTKYLYKNRVRALTQ